VPEIVDYIAEVTVSVSLRQVRTAGGEQTLTTYSVTRVAKGTTHTSAPTGKGGGATGTIERAVVDAVAAEKALRAGAQNAEARRLK
jgi:hypothetical protein